MVFDAQKAVRFCDAIARWFFIMCICLAGILLLFLALLALIGVSETGTPPAGRIPLSFALFAAGVGCFLGARSLTLYLRRRRNRNR